MTLRIAHVIASIADLATGPAQSVPAMCNELAKLGNEVELHVLATGGATRRDDELYRLVSYPLWPGMGRIGFSPAMLEGLRAAAQRVDVMHWHGLWMMPNVYPAWAVRDTPCRLVFSPRGTLEPAAMQRSRRVKSLAWRYLQRPAVEAAKLIHATSTLERDSALNAGLTQPIVLVENGIYLPDESLVERARQDRDERARLLYLGRVHPIKGLDRLIRAWQRLEPLFPNWDLEIVGPDGAGHVEELQTLARKLRVQRVSFEGALLGAERDRRLARADLYVLPSHSENFAMSVAEALGAGTPVVCSRGAPWRDLEVRKCGLWIPNEVEDLSDGLAKLMRLSRAERDRMGNSGRDWMRSDFSWSSKAAALATAYRELLLLSGSSPAPSPLASRQV